MAYGHHVEPENEAISQRISWVKAQRVKLEPTVPSLLKDEKQINPFMRVHESSVQAHAKQTDPIQTMRALRAEKDGFKAK